MHRRKRKERFWTKILFLGGDKCWLWKGAKHDRDGYGMTFWDGRPQRAHRVAWQIVRGPIPDSANVCHKCDNPPCCNPGHMFLGTKKQNMEDAVEKSRHAHGSRHGKAILNEDSVYEVRLRFAAGVSVPSLAHEYSMSEHGMWRALKGLTWKHVPLPPTRKFSSRRDGKVMMRSKYVRRPTAQSAAMGSLGAILAQSAGKTDCATAAADSTSITPSTTNAALEPPRESPV